MANNSDYSLRPEAGPIPYLKHQRRAKEALKLIMRALIAAADTAKKSKANEVDFAERASRIFFVSGEPGSGKSTLYLTLRGMLSSKEHGTYAKGYTDTAGLGALQKAVRLLDPLDLEVAGHEGENLLAAVLVRLFGALDETSTVLSKNCEDAIKELEELATDIGIAWEGNLQARAGAIDPETYSGEVMRTQRARLGVNKRLKEALDKLAFNECCGCPKEILFVLPVDDFYLKPDASLQLLRLLRMISIPRLFFLVMGDIDTVESLFIEKSLADWTAVAGTELFPAGSERLDQAQRRAKELRARYLRKLLPPGQRATIDAMDWYEALDFEVGPHSGSAEVYLLENLMGDVKLDSKFPEIKPSSESLLAFLVSPPFSEQEKQTRKHRASEDSKDKELLAEGSIRRDRAAYTALQILDATPREMMDLGYALREVIKKQKIRMEDRTTVDDDAPLLLSCVQDFVNLVKEEHSFLNEKEQAVLEWVLPTRHYSPEDINFRMDRLSLQPAQWTWTKLGQQWVRKHRSWNLSVNRKLINYSTSEAKEAELADRDPFANLPPRPAAWFILLHDLAWKWKPDSLSGNLVSGLCKELTQWKLQESKVKSQLIQKDGSPLAKESVEGASYAKDEGAEQEIDPLEAFEGWAVWHDETEGQYRHFPMPKFETFRDLDHFLRVWSRGLEGLEKLNALKAPGIISSLWTLAGWVVLAGAYKNFSEDGDDWLKTLAETSGTLEKRLRKFKNKLKGKYPSQTKGELGGWLKGDEWPVQLKQV